VLLCTSDNGFASRFINPKWFFAEQMFVGLNCRAINFLMKVMRHRYIDRFDFGIGEEGLVILGELLDGWEAILKPGKPRGIPIANRDDFRPNIHVRQVKPAR